MGQEEQFKYDTRKKVLHRTIKQADKVVIGGDEIGKYDIVNTQEYSVDGVKKLVGELLMQKDKMQRYLTQVNNTLEATKHLKEDEELLELKQKLEKLKKYDERIKAQEQRDNLLDELKVLNKQVSDIKSACGVHVKF